MITYNKTITCEHFISRGGRIFEILPKSEEIAMQEKINQSLPGIHNLRNVTAVTFLRFIYLGIT